MADQAISSICPASQAFGGANSTIRILTHELSIPPFASLVIARYLVVVDSRVSNEEDICEVLSGDKPAIDYSSGDINSEDFNSAKLTSYTFTKSGKSGPLLIAFQFCLRVPRGPREVSLCQPYPQVAERQLREFRKYARGGKIDMMYNPRPITEYDSLLQSYENYSARLRINMEDLVGSEGLENR